MCAHVYGGRRPARRCGAGESRKGYYLQYTEKIVEKTIYDTSYEELYGEAWEVFVIRPYLFYLF